MQLDLGTNVMLWFGKVESNVRMTGRFALLGIQQPILPESMMLETKYLAEAEAGTGENRSALTEAAATNLYKLMAYMDEYEIPRLRTLLQARADMEAQYDAGARVSWNFHPTFLRSLGVRKKVRPEPWFAPTLRGTPLDLPGDTRVRRK